MKKFNLKNGKELFVHEYMDDRLVVVIVYNKNKNKKLYITDVKYEDLEEAREITEAYIMETKGFNLAFSFKILNVYSSFNPYLAYTKWEDDELCYVVKDENKSEDISHFHITKNGFIEIKPDLGDIVRKIKSLKSSLETFMHNLKYYDETAPKLMLERRPDLVKNLLFKERVLIESNYYVGHKLKLQCINDFKVALWSGEKTSDGGERNFILSEFQVSAPLVERELMTDDEIMQKVAEIATECIND